jgi:hypothetical protein
MEDEIFEHSITFCWKDACQRNIPYRIIWVQEDERRARIVNPAEKIMDDAAGIEPMTSR